MEVEALVVGIVFSIFNILIGFIIKKFQVAEIIAGYNPKIHNKEKVCNIVGSNFLLMGMLMVPLTIFYYYGGLNTDIYVYTLIAIMVILIVKIMFDTKRDATVTKNK